MLITTDESHCKFIADYLRRNCLWRLPGVESKFARLWRISPSLFSLDTEIVKILERLGSAIWSFYSAVNRLYLSGNYPWVNEYLDIGKPDSLIEHAHMNYQKRMLPRVIRPDILLTEQGLRVTEFDSVPGGIGLTAAMSIAYGQCGQESIGGTEGMLSGFNAMLSDVSGIDNPAVAILVSDESADYRPEMEWLASELRVRGRSVWAVRPEEVIFTEDAIFIDVENQRVKIDVIYRFYELFDLKNIPKAELIAYAAKKKLVMVTPPYKHHLEEKLLLALISHPMLEDWFLSEMEEGEFFLLREVVSPTWVLDSRLVPPHALIPGFRFRGKAVQDWRVIEDATQKERRLVIKPSGFSPLAWGSRGVVVGHDVSSDKWAAAVESALTNFNSSPSVLQEFHDSKRVRVRYYDESSDCVVEMDGRVRLCPYYFVEGDGVKLRGVLATIVPLDKKFIHGMLDAVMVPCMVEGNA